MRSATGENRLALSFDRSLAWEMSDTMRLGGDAMGDGGRRARPDEGLGGARRWSLSRREDGMVLWKEPAWAPRCTSAAVESPETLKKEEADCGNGSVSGKLRLEPESESGDILERDLGLADLMSDTSRLRRNRGGGGRVCVRRRTGGGGKRGRREGAERGRGGGGVGEGCGRKGANGGCVRMGMRIGGVCWGWQRGAGQRLEGWGAGGGERG